MPMGAGLGIVCAMLLLGCEGTVDSLAGPKGTNVSPTGPNAPAICEGVTAEGAPVPLKRLTAVQVTRTIKDILGTDEPLLVTDEKLATAFRSNVSSAVDSSSARAYFDFAEASVDGMDMAPCTDAACEAWVLDTVAPRLFRRALDADERARYAALYAEGVEVDGPEEGARWALQALLMSPSFLYIDEVTDDSGILDGPSVAGRLALTLWGMNPDADLLERALAGELDTPAAVRAEAVRMLADPRSDGGLRDFVDQWFELAKLAQVDARPDIAALGAETVAALRNEPVLFFEQTLSSEGGLPELLTGTSTARSDALRDLYGDDIESETDDTFELDPERRAGILTLPGVMAALAHAEVTSPTMRGHTILGNLFCKPPPPPPAGLDVTVPPVVPGTTTRERLETHFSDPSCSSCHKSMDGVGFAFEGFDWLGRSRTEDNGLPVDSKSDLLIGKDTIPVDGAVELANVISDREEIATCVAKQWIRYATGISETKNAKCLVAEMAADVAKADGLRNMMLTYVSSDWFRRGNGANQ